MTMKKRIFTSLLCFALLLVLGGGNFLSAFFVKAEAAEAPSIVTSDPLDDLKGATVAGVPFDVANYPFAADKSPALLTLLEYGCDLEKNENFQLYIYVYNPKGSTFIYSEYNLVSMRLGGDKSAPFNEYQVELVNFSQDASHYGKIYKYRILLSAEQKAALCKQERVYELAELQLIKKESSGGTAPETIPCISKYTYTGFTAGVIQEGAPASLKCLQENSEAVSLAVQFAIFRPGNPLSIEQKTTQASLHSVYFAVPKRYQDDYGNLTRIRGSWKDARLKSSLVVGDKVIYEDASRFACEDLTGLYDSTVTITEKPQFAFFSDFYLNAFYISASKTWGFRNLDWKKMSLVANYNFSYYFNKLYLVFGTDFDNYDEEESCCIDSADDWTVSGNEIKRKVEEASARLLTQGYTETVGLNKYSAELFEEGSVVDRVLDVTSDTEFRLQNTVLSQNWWQKLWGTYTVESADFDGIEGIKVLNDGDFTGNAEEAAKNLFVSDGDYKELKEYYEKNSADNYIYLIRYEVTEYVSEEAEVLGYADDGYGVVLMDEKTGNLKGLPGKYSLRYYDAEGMGLNTVYSNAYFFQETINLDFNIIDLTFTTDGKDTVVPVIMTPQDFFPDATPPLETEDSIRKADWDWIMLLVKIAAVAVIVFLFILLWDKCLKPVFKFIWNGIKYIFNILTWPFRWLLEQLDKK